MRLLIDLIKQLHYWDRASRMALGLAILLFVCLSLLGLFGNPDLQGPLLAGSVGLLIAMQGIVMWGNRHMVTPFYAAQRAYLAGEFEEAKTLLEDDIALYTADDKRAPIDHLVLLGNLYRQMGDLEQSAEILEEATTIKPSYHFPLYGYGRTLLVLGDYDSAVTWMQRALDNGAPTSIRADILHAIYRTGSWGTLSEWVTQDIEELEPYRQLMQDWILHQVEGNVFSLDAYPPHAVEFWKSEVERFSASPYAIALQNDLMRMKSSREHSIG